MRKDLNVGEEFLIIKDQHRIVLKKISNLTEKLKEDLRFAKQVEKAWNDYENGKFAQRKAQVFLEELDRC